MWIYFLGPLLSVLPRRWRRALPFYYSVPWRFAAILSGLAEAVIALVALMYWYSYSVTSWVSNALDSVLSKNAPTGITDHELGFAGLVVWATHPLTWVIVLAGIEGTARLCAALADSVLGVFPLYLVEKTYSKIFCRGAPEPEWKPEFSKSHIASYLDSMREKVAAMGLSRVPDELSFAKSAADEVLEIRAWRAKRGWDPPRVVYYEDRYYRLEECARGRSPRPYVYRLRRLPAGVPGRTVLTYSPNETPVHN